MDLLEISKLEKLSKDKLNKYISKKKDKLINLQLEINHIQYGYALKEVEDKRDELEKHIELCLDLLDLKY